MELGWIYLSDNDRNKVLEMLRANNSDARDELGVGNIRDRFSDIFFPGTTTIQTRAKYFILVPYICLKLEKEIYNKPKKFGALLDVRKRLREIEYEFCKHLKDEPDSSGVIGKQMAEKQNSSSEKWVKNTPTDIYWGGLRTYKIFTKNIPLNGYFKDLIDSANNKNKIDKVNRRSRNSEEDISDDYNSDFYKTETFWDYRLNDIDINYSSIKLNKVEAEYLKNKIIESNPNSLLAIILKDIDSDGNFRSQNNFSKILDIEFNDLIKIYNYLPDDLKEFYQMAKDFSDFFYLIQIRYNYIFFNKLTEFLKGSTSNVEIVRNLQEVTESKEKEWKEKLQEKEIIDALNNVNIDEIFERLSINDGNLKKFLGNCQHHILSNGNSRVEDLDKLIINREFQKKKGKSKLSNINKYADEYIKEGVIISDNVGLSKLSYRMYQGKRIINDIIEGLNSENE